MQKGILCHWDHFRIEQVFENIVSNAIKYAPGTKIEIKIAEKNSNVEISIEDHGPGIEKNMLTGIFDRFVRSRTSSYIQSLGLGLFIAKQIVEAQGGSISVKSETGKDASFFLSLPKDPRRS